MAKSKLEQAAIRWANKYGKDFPMSDPIDLSIAGEMVGKSVLRAAERMSFKAKLLNKNKTDSPLHDKNILFLDDLRKWVEGE